MSPDRKTNQSAAHSLSPDQADAGSNASGHDPVGNRRPALAAMFIAAGIYLLFTWSLIAGVGWSNHQFNARGLTDEQRYYLPTIVHFAENFPSVYLGDYPSAMTPAYHLSLAVLMRWVSGSVPFLRVVGSLYGAVLAGALAWGLARRLNLWQAVLMTLPLSLSLYVISSGAWLLPDNAGWLGMLLMLLVALRHGVDWQTYVWGGLILFVLVMTRQIHLWTAGPLVVAAWLGSSHDLIPRSPEDLIGDRLKRLAGIMLAILPSLAALTVLIILWHGLTPPSFQGRYNGRNPAAPAAILALMGGYGLFFCGFQVELRQKILPRWRWVLVGAAVGALAAILPVTTFNHQAGRSSGIWNIVAHLPMIANRSILILGLSILGGMIVSAWLVIMPRRDAIIMAVTLVCFIGATAANPFAWQRYIEPFVLIFLSLAMVRSQPAGVVQLRIRHRLLAWMPVAVLAMIQLAMTLLFTVFFSGNG